MRENTWRGTKLHSNQRKMIIYSILIISLISIQLIKSVSVADQLNIRPLITKALDTYCENDVDNERRKISKFDSIEPPEIEIKDYLDRIFMFCGCQEQDFVFAMIYIERYCDKNNISVHRFTVHRLLAASTLAAFKFRHEHHHPTSYYAAIYGLFTPGIFLLLFLFWILIIILLIDNLPELIELEKVFLKGIDFHLFVEEKEVLCSILCVLQNLCGLILLKHV